MTVARLGRRGPVPAVLQGTPPGTVYALIALGFVLTYKTSGVFNLAFGPRRTCRPPCTSRPRVEWGWADRAGAGRLGLRAGAAARPRARALIFRHLRTGSAVAKLVVAIGLTVAIPAIFELLDFEPVAGARPRASSPTAPPSSTTRSASTRFSRNELVAMAVAVVAMAGLGACSASPASACRCGPSSRARDDRAQRHRGRPGVGVRLGAVVSLFAGWRAC